MVVGGATNKRGEIGSGLPRSARGTVPCWRAGVVGSHLLRHQRALFEEGHPAPPEQRSESGHRQDRQGRADDTAHALNLSGVGPSEPGSVPAVWQALISDPLEPRLAPPAYWFRCDSSPGLIRQ